MCAERGRRGAGGSLGGTHLFLEIFALFSDLSFFSLFFLLSLSQIPFFEASAKCRLNIDEVYIAAARVGRSNPAKIVMLGDSSLSFFLSLSLFLHSLSLSLSFSLSQAFLILLSLSLFLISNRGRGSGQERVHCAVHTMRLR